MHVAMPDSAPVCRRCGACCRDGGPALHVRDLPLLRDGVLAPTDLMTLRRGEYVTDNVAGTVGPSPVELVKIRPVPGGRTCRFYRAGTTGACAIHRHRPAQCRALFCQAPKALAAMYRTELLTRRDILGPASPLAELCAHHEAETGLLRLEELCRQALSGDADAREAVIRADRLDAAMRDLVPERAGVPPEMLLFLFGRPLRQALPACRAVLTPPALYKDGPSA
ncbi:YkgJ family cysteine cluster protein [Desulfovibrio sp. JY]|nr:YkgJ family cysteine cluster protein [Desulfovibrio sp. JY]